MPASMMIALVASRP